MKKIAIIGAGNVGAHIASALLHQRKSREIFLLDANDELEQGQVLDLHDAVSYCPESSISCLDFGDKRISEIDIFIITAGAKQRVGETRLDLLERNIHILKSIRNSLGSINPNAIIIMVSNPVDVLTRCAAKIFDLPSSQVFGTGTALDTARLRWHLSDFFQTTDVPRENNFVLGEHGNSQLVAWSSVERAGEIPETDKNMIALSVRREAYDIVEKKGATFFGIGMTTAHIITEIENPTGEIIPLSVCLNGDFGVSDVAIGVPCVLGNKGIERVHEIKLSKTETEQFHKSVNILNEAFNSIEL